MVANTCLTLSDQGTAILAHLAILVINGILVCSCERLFDQFGLSHLLAINFRCSLQHFDPGAPVYF